MSELKENSAPARARNSWLLLPLFLLLAAAAALWGIRQIENQVLSAAPTMLLDAGIDPAGLNFDVEYRDVTVSGVLPEGVNATQVRRVLEQGRGSAGEDIRNAIVVAGAETGELVADDSVDATGSAVADNATNVSGVDDVTVAGDLPAVSEPVVAKTAAFETKATETTAQDSAVDEAREAIGSDPRINILLAGDELMLSGRDVSKGQVDLLLLAANSAVGATNVKQQWQSEQLPEVSTTTPQADHADQVKALSRLVVELGEHASVASITLENQVIRGSIEARSERSKEYLKAYSGDGVVITTAVFSAESGTGAAADPDPDTGAEAGAESANQPDKLVASQPTRTGMSADASSSQPNTSTVPGKLDVNDKETRLQQEITALQVEIDALQKLIDNDVFFVHDSSAVTREALPILDSVASAIKRYRRPGVAIEGHTDSLASRSYNLKLSKRRASSVMQYLMQQGINEKRLRSEGYGEDRPITSNRSKQGRRLNRRVEFIARRPFAKGE